MDPLKASEGFRSGTTPETIVDAPDRAKRGRPKTLSDSARRAAILVKAREIFLDRGYGGTTTDRVADACGMSKRTIYRLFASKADLFSALVDDHRRTMLALPLEQSQEDLPLDDALAAIFRLDIDPAIRKSARPSTATVSAKPGACWQIGWPTNVPEGVLMWKTPRVQHGC
jgi:AcrR family transcriptional regulator